MSSIQNLDYIKESHGLSRKTHRQFRNKQKQARHHTATIFKLLRQSRSCSSCHCKMDQHGVFSVRPHLICDENGQRLICGKCHREGDHGEPIRAFAHGSFPRSDKEWDAFSKPVDQWTVKTR